MLQLRFMLPSRRLPVCLAVLAFVGLPAVRAADDVDNYRVYVTNEGSGDLSVISPASDAVIATWPLGKRPRGVATSPDGSRVYVALSGSPLAGPGIDAAALPPPDKTADGVGVVNAATGRIERVLRGVSDPEQLAITADGRLLIVASEDTGRAVVIDVESGAIRASVDVGAEPEGVAASADGARWYVTSEAANTVSIIDAQTHGVRARVVVGERPRDVALGADGAHAYVTGELDDSLTVLALPGGTVAQVLNVPGDGARPKGVVVARDGRVYVTTGRGGSVAAFAGSPLVAEATITVGGRPWGIALSPDAGRLYTADGPTNEIAVIDRATLHLVAKISVGQRPWGVAVARTPLPR